MRRPALLAAILAGFASTAGCGHGHLIPSFAEPEMLLVRTFSCDATPPVGHPLCGGWITPVVDVKAPLLLKGILLQVRMDRPTNLDSDPHEGHQWERYVLCSLDWCRLQTGAYDRLRTTIAKAAECDVSHVALHTVHQHDAPIADYDAQLLLNRETAAPPHLDLRFFDDLCKRVGDAIQYHASPWHTIRRVGFGKAKVEKFASNRRSVVVDGKILQRGSSSKDPRHQEAPEGLIDPWLRTVSFYDERDMPVARLHFYATHPQSYYGEGHVTSDTAGIARERLQTWETECYRGRNRKARAASSGQDTYWEPNWKGVFQIYFTGCGGNVAAGKYNRGTPEDRKALTDRLYDAMKRSVADTRKVPVNDETWSSGVKTVKAKVELRTEPEFAEDRFRKQIADPAGKPVDRLKAALGLAWIERWKKDPEVDLTALQLGPVRILGLPGEAFVEYQLYAQSLRPDDFVCVAAYGDCGPGYICLDEDLTKGGYEPTMSMVGPPSEKRLKAAIEELLR